LSVVEVDEIPVTEAFVRQFVEKIQGVIEAKLIPAPLPSVITIQSDTQALAIKSLLSILHHITRTVSPPQVLAMLVQLHHSLPILSKRMLAILLHPSLNPPVEYMTQIGNVGIEVQSNIFH